MYDPYDNNRQNQDSYDRQAENRNAAQGCTAQTRSSQPEAGASSASSGAANGQGGQSGAPGTYPSVTYHSGPIQTGQAYVPPQNAGPYGGQADGRGYSSQPQQNAYTWNPQGAQPPYGTVQQPAPKKVKKPRKHSPGKVFAKILAAVLCCAVVSMGSVGAFVALIQNGVVNVQSQGGENTTAAFTLYKKAETASSAPVTVTEESLTPQEIAQQLIPSVVCVQNYQILQQNSFESFLFGFGYGNGDYGSDDSSLSPVGTGSGIIISEDGYIVTNQHVIDGATNLKVVTYDGMTYEAELVGEDTQTDLAVIKITTEDTLTPAKFGSSGDLQVADEVMAIGNPGGLQLSSSTTFGRISALNRPVTNSETGYTTNCIQTDAAINPGNSGGALVDMNGYVVGINSSKIAATEYEGLGFAIPSDTAQPIVSDLIEYGYVKDRAAPGFSGEYVERLRASWYGMNPGYYVTEVTTETAAASGLQRGDMITAIDDTQVTSSSTIALYLTDKKPGDKVTLTVDRTLSGQSGTTLTLTLSENSGKSVK